ncbi:hypothetical protein [Gossypium barbadense]|uniref:tRNA (adenine(58)-N(1))-methyltransferase n=3 Tax=Gossypium TaxID=3633 RepID=A0A5J5NDA0_GOSBA|nr:hypothetical protein [Gossypium barbadense]TYG96971.1 hypothetical protein ES288_A11G396400v1 [Gossypium darwinii]
MDSSMKISFNRCIRDGDLIIVNERHDTMKAVKVCENLILQNHVGVFKHSDWVGKPFGSITFSNKGGFVYLLAPAPELWTLVLSHRTQILYIADIIFVIMYLEGLCLTRNSEEPSHIVSMFDYLWSKTIATILWPLHVLPTKFVFKKIRSAIGIQKTAKSEGGGLLTHIEKFYETIGLEVQNGYGLIETSPCVAGRQPYYNVYNSLFRSVFEIYRDGSVCFFLVAFSETDFRFRHHCFDPCFKSIDLDLFVLFVCFLCTFARYKS